MIKMIKRAFILNIKSFEVLGGVPNRNCSFNPFFKRIKKLHSLRREAFSSFDLKFFYKYNTDQKKVSCYWDDTKTKKD